MRKHITDITTDVVRSLGGTPETGGQYLCPEKLPLTLFGHKLRAVRLPKGCKAAEMPPEELLPKVEALFRQNRDDPQKRIDIIRAVLTPPAPAHAATAATAMSMSPPVPTSGNFSPGTGG